MKLTKVRLFFVLKDLLIGVAYFILLKFNITGETDSDEMLSEFPTASEIFIEIPLVSVYILWFPILIDLIILQIFHRYMFNNSEKINDFFIGIILNIPIIIILILIYGDMNRTLITSLIITTFFSGLTFSKLKEMDKEDDNGMLDTIGK